MSHRIPSMVLLVVLVVALAPGHAAAERGAMGLAVGVQNADTGIRLPIWVNEDIVITPGLSLVSVSDAATDLALGLQIRRNLRAGDAVPYIGVGANVLTAMPEEGDNVTDFLFSGVLGGEAFLRESLSIGVEAQLNVGISDETSARFGIPDGTIVSTGSVIYGAFYF